MKLVVLGSGTSVPHPARSSPAFWLETAGGSILLDAGADAPHRMAQEKLDWPNLDAIWISHFHLDHLGGLLPFLFSMKWAPQVQGREKPLQILGAAGLRKLVTSINETGNYRLFDQNFPLEIVEVASGDEFEILPNLVARTLSTPHTQESLALRLSERGAKSIVYTSDTGFSEELVGFASEVDLLLLECSFIRNKPVPTHLELREAMQLARACLAKKLVLTHLYPQWDEFDLVAEAKALWRGETVEATEGLRLVI